MQAGEPNKTPADLPMAKPALPIAKPVEMNAVFVNQAVSIHGIWHTIVGWIIFIACFAVIAAILDPYTKPSSRSPIAQWGLIIGYAILASLIGALVPWIQRIRTRRRVRSIIAENPMMPLDELVDLIQKQRCRLSRYAATEEMVRLLAEEGRCDEIARFAHPREMKSVSPLHVAFEPRLLDETDAAFRELTDSTTPEGPTQRRHANKDSLALRKLLRNMHLKEGKLSLFVFVAFWALAVLDFFATGTITMSLMFWTILIVLSLFSPASGGALLNKWHIIPAGLFVHLGPNPHKAKWYTFDRRESILAVHQLTRHKWIVFASDGQLPMEFKATTEEVHMLLRAWLSPLPAIPTERLAALASA